MNLIGCKARVWNGCQNIQRKGRATCSDHCQDARRVGMQAVKRGEDPRIAVRKMPPSLDGEQPVSDGYYCGGCRFLKSCPGQERGVQCIGGRYRDCAPWTGQPRMKERA
jgi:hypothetical protein